MGEKTVSGVLLSALLFLCAFAPQTTGAPIDEGLALFQAGRYQEALPHFLSATRTNPRNAAHWTWLGATYLKLERFSEAVGSLGRAVALNPNAAVGHFYLGMAYASAGETGKARAAFLRAQQIDPTGPYAAPSVAWLESLPGADSSPKGPSLVSRAGADNTAGLAKGNCPSVPSLAPAQSPAQSKEVGSVVRVSDWELEQEKETLIVWVELETVKEEALQTVSVRVTGLGLTGTEVSAANGVVRSVNPDEPGELEVKLPISPPIFWVKVQIVDYPGRRPTDRLHVLVERIPDPTLALYAGMAKSRVKVGSRLTPSTPATRHSGCLYVVDAGGFPVRAVQVKAVFRGRSGGRIVEQIKTVRITSDGGGSVEVEWPSPMTLTLSTEVMSVELSPPPPVK